MHKTKANLVELKALRNTAGESAYKRVKLAADVLADKTWIATEFAGDEFKANEFLEDEYFGDLCGAVDLSELLAVYAAFPDVETWRKAKFSLKALWAEVLVKRQADKEPTERTRKAVTLKEHAEVVEEKKKVEWELRTKDDNLRKMMTENEKLRHRVSELERDNARLEGRLAELERFSDRRLVAA